MNYNGITQDQQSALKLFNFHASKILSGRFYYQSKNFGYNLHNIPLTVDIGMSGDRLPKLMFTIVGTIKHKPVFRKWEYLSDLIVDLIDNREKYFYMSYAYNVFRIVESFNTILDVDLGKEPHKINIWKVKKLYEVGKWGGVDKDGEFSTFAETKYFLTFDGYIVNDQYLKKILRPCNEFISSYKDYKSTNDTMQDEYFVEKVNDDKKDEFLKKYNYSEHKAVLSNID